MTHAAAHARVRVCVCVAGDRARGRRLRDGSCVAGGTAERAARVPAPAGVAAGGECGACAVSPLPRRRRPNARARVCVCDVQEVQGSITAADRVNTKQREDYQRQQQKLNEFKDEVEVLKNELQKAANDLLQRRCVCAVCVCAVCAFAALSRVACVSRFAQRPCARARNSAWVCERWVCVHMVRAWRSSLRGAAAAALQHGEREPER